MVREPPSHLLQFQQQFAGILQHDSQWEGSKEKLEIEKDDENSNRATLLRKHIGTLMAGFDTFREAHSVRQIEAELRFPFDILLRLVWQLSGLEKTKVM